VNEYQSKFLIYSTHSHREYIFSWILRPDHVEANHKAARFIVAVRATRNDRNERGEIDRLAKSFVLKRDGSVVTSGREKKHFARL